MNIKELKDVLTRIDSEFHGYCNTNEGSDSWLALDKTVGELLANIAEADNVKTVVFQKGGKYYEPIYAQVFDGNKLAVLNCRAVKVDSVKFRYLIPLGKAVEIGALLPNAVGNGSARSSGMGGVGGGRKD